MKKNSLIASILTIAMCFSIISGSTYALFTSESRVNVAVKAANIDIVATVENVALDSTLGENLAQTSADFDEENNVISLEKIVPGDVVSFDIRVSNNSDVSVSYRTVISKVADDGLWEALSVTIDGIEYDGYSKRSNWTLVAPGSEDIIVPVTVTLPEDADNSYKGTSCELAYKVEAVQGNVDTTLIMDEATDISDALGAGEDVMLNEDISFSADDTTANSGYGKTGVAVKGGVLNGNGNTLNVTDANSTWDCAVNATGGIIKNITITGAMRGIFMGSATSDLVIDNVVLKDVIYTFNSDGGSKDYTVTIKNSELYGWTSFSDVHKYVYFENCTFGEGSGYAFCRPYNDVTFTNCTFEEGFEFDTSEGCTIVFENCYYGDTLITNENATTLGSGETVFLYNGIGGLKIPYEVSDSASLESALENGDHITLADDVQTEAEKTAPYGNKVALVQNGGVFDGNGKTLSVDTYGDDYAVMTSGGTIKNLTIDSGCRAIVVMSATEDLILDNVYVSGDILYAINTTEHATVDGLKLIVTNSTFGGWSSFDGGFESASFTDCTFIEGDYGYGWPYETLVKPYITTTFTNCEFELDEDGNGYYLDLSALAEGATVTLKNCTVNGVLITAENVDILGDATDFFGIELPSGRTLSDCVIFE